MNTDFLDSDAASAVKPQSQSQPQPLKEEVHATESKSSVTSQAKVSTGKPETTKPEAKVIVQEGKRPTVLYDPREATFEYGFIIPEEQPYVVRAKENVEKQGWVVTNTLREAMELRQGLAFDSGPLPACRIAVSRREADILLRSRTLLTNLFFQKALQEPGSFLTEDGIRLEQVFVLRARYNKGIEWKNTKRAQCDELNKEKGDQRLRDLAAMLQQIGLPLHPEEVDIGLHPEFLKPEWLTWSQFQVKMNQVQKLRTIAEKEEMENLVALVSSHIA